MATKEMTGLIALGYMLIEEGKIVAIRNEERYLRIDYDDIKGGQVFTTARGDLEAGGWCVGWSCCRCMGDGVITVPCPCVQRSQHAQMNNPCCGGWDEIECTECTGGVRWEKEY